MPVVEDALVVGASCGAVNWSEVAQKTLARGAWREAKLLLSSYDLRVEPVTAEDAEWAARRWRRGEGLSLADRLCQALAHRLGVDVLTADRLWGDDPPVVQIR
jgi:PIN domain nuclease of toxin-antitoxin system